MSINFTFGPDIFIIYCFLYLKMRRFWIVLIAIGLTMMLALTKYQHNREE